MREVSTYLLLGIELSVEERAALLAPIGERALERAGEAHPGVEFHLGFFNDQEDYPAAGPEERANLPLLVSWEDGPARGSVEACLDEFEIELSCPALGQTLAPVRMVSGWREMSPAASIALILAGCESNPNLDKQVDTWAQESNGLSCWGLIQRGAQSVWAAQNPHEQPLTDPLEAMQEVELAGLEAHLSLARAAFALRDEDDPDPVLRWILSEGRDVIRAALAPARSEARA